MPAPTGGELIDRVDRQDHVVGTMRRDQALSAGGGFRVVHALVVNSAGQLLLQQVGAGRTRSANRWGSSVAGYLHAGETPLHGVNRRAREEIGVAGPFEFLGRAPMPDGRGTKFIYVFCASGESAEIVDHQHVQALSFWSVEEIRRELEEGGGAFTETLPYVFALYDRESSR